MQPSPVQECVSLGRFRGTVSVYEPAKGYGFIKGKEEERAEATRQIHYKVWLELVRRRRQITTNEFKTIFPEAGYKIDLWNECVD